jgi:hypothetical protein
MKAIHRYLTGGRPFFIKGVFIEDGRLNQKNTHQAITA